MKAEREKKSFKKSETGNTGSKFLNMKIHFIVRTAELNFQTFQIRPTRNTGQRNELMLETVEVELLKRMKAEMESDSTAVCCGWIGLDQEKKLERKRD